MDGCDLTGGRLYSDCDDIAGVKTVYFFKHDLLDIKKNAFGEVAEIGCGYVYRFEQDDLHGTAVQEIVRGQGETQYLRQQIDLTLFYIDKQVLPIINVLKQGSWAIMWMDYNGKIRLFGELSAMTQGEGVSQSGRSAGDRKWSNLSFVGIANNYAPFLIDFNKLPFDNIPCIEVVPEYTGKEDLLKYSDTEYYLQGDGRIKYT